jgi:hypothetical protein
MKRKIISIAVIAVLMLAGFTSVSSKNNIKSNFSNTSPILIPSDEKQEIDDFIEDKKDEDALTEIKNIKDRVIKEDETDDKIVNIDLAELGQVIQDYEFVGAGDPIQEFIWLILNLDQVVAQLGWLYIGFNYVITIRQDAEIVWNDRYTPVVLLEEVGNLITECIELIQIFGNILKREGGQLIPLIENIISILTIIDSIISQIENVSSHVQKLIYDLEEFNQWYQSYPFDDDITVHGQVFRDSSPVEGASISCREISGNTDEGGNYSFTVPSTPDSDSIPETEWGFHKCVITVSVNDEVKNSTDIFSYVLSGGSIYREFVFEEGDDAKNTKHIKNICISQRLYFIFNDLLKNLFLFNFFK